MAYLSRLEFEWDEDKDSRNRAKHGVSFAEAAALFISGVDFLEIFDAEHSNLEDRFIAIGPIEPGIVVVVYTEREEDAVRIIGARWQPDTSGTSTAHTWTRTDDRHPRTDRRTDEERDPRPPAQAADAGSIRIR